MLVIKVNKYYMLFALTDTKKIEKINRFFFKELSAYRTFLDERLIIYPQSSKDDIFRISYSNVLGIWWYTNYAGKDSNRFWNIFGIDNPEVKQNVNIVCEINMPVSGINFRTAGLWAKDLNGNTFLLHSGKIGGGTKGVGKGLFEREFRGEKIEVEIQGRIREYALVAQLGSDKLGEQVASFTKEIYRIKTIARKLNKRSPKGIKSFYSPEFFGKKEYRLPEKITANCNHGLVVSELVNELSRRKIKAYNYFNFIDLYTHNNRQKIDRVFEIKTSLSRQVVYTAIGQLFLNSYNIVGKPKRIFICPNTIEKVLVSDLAKMGITVITFDWRKRSVVFNNLDTCL